MPSAEILTLSVKCPYYSLISTFICGVYASDLVATPAKVIEKMRFSTSNFEKGLSGKIVFTYGRHFFKMFTKSKTSFLFVVIISIIRDKLREKGIIIDETCY